MGGRKEEREEKAGDLGCFPFPEPVLTSDERQWDVWLGYDRCEKVSKTKHLQGTSGVEEGAVTWGPL